MKLFSFLVPFLLYFSITAQEKRVETQKAKGMAEEITAHLQNDEFKKISLLLSDGLTTKLSPEQFKKSFDQLQEKYGEIKSIIDFTELVKAEKTYYHQGIQFENKKFDLIFSLDDQEKLTSLRIAPYTMKSKWEAPEYAELNTFDQKKIEIGDSLSLLAEYCTPSSQNTFPTVVMVHGSGPNDMDETVGPNKLFKDLAYGLASNNIASIRYNKRTYDYPSLIQKEINSVTIDKIVVDDAVKAVKKAHELGAEKVILLGHSLGGHLAPKIAEKAELDGVVIMAGNVTPLEDLILPQFEYLMENDSTTEISEFQYNAVKYQIDNLKSSKFDSTTVGANLPLGLPGSFWLSLQDYEPQKVSKMQNIPYLILNGERDYQVPPKEAKKWKNGNNHEQSTTIIYPGLNHLFFFGEGILLPSEYEQKNHMDKKVLVDIIEWIKML